MRKREWHRKTNDSDSRNIRVEQASGQPFSCNYPLKAQSYAGWLTIPAVKLDFSETLTPEAQRGFAAAVKKIQELCR
jgi:hypothetical protein